MYVVTALGVGITAFAAILLYLNYPFDDQELTSVTQKNPPNWTIINPLMVAVFNVTGKAFADAFMAVSNNTQGVQSLHSNLGDTNHRIKKIENINMLLIATTIALVAILAIDKRHTVLSPAMKLYDCIKNKYNRSYKEVGSEESVLDLEEGSERDSLLTK